MNRNRVDDEAPRQYQRQREQEATRSKIRKDVQEAYDAYKDRPNEETHKALLEKMDYLLNTLKNTGVNQWIYQVLESTHGDINALHARQPDGLLNGLRNPADIHNEQNNVKEFFQSLVLDR